MPGHPIVALWLVPWLEGSACSPCQMEVLQAGGLQAMQTLENLCLGCLNSGVGTDGRHKLLQYVLIS